MLGSPPAGSVGSAAGIAHAAHALAGSGTRGDASLDGGGIEIGEQRLFRGERIGLGWVCLGAEPLLLEPARDAPGHPAGHARDLGVVRRPQRVEAHAPFGAAGVDAIEDERVEVEVQIQRVAEALHEGDGAALAAREPPLLSRSAPERGEDRAHEDGEDQARKARVVGEAVAERKGQREHPLAHGHLGQHAVDEMGGRVGHAPAATGGAEAAPLAGKSDEAIVAAGLAAHAHEAVGEDSALEIAAELALDEARHGALALPRAGEEGFELLAHHRVEDRLLGMAGNVGRRAARERGGGSASRGARLVVHPAPGLRTACLARG